MPFIPPRRSCALKVLVATGLMMGWGVVAQAQTVPAASGSSLQEIAGLKLNCPVPMTKKPEAAQAADSPVKEMLIYEAKTEGADITLSSLEFAPGLNLSLDGAIEGAVASVAKLPGVTSPSHTTEEVTMAGAIAKRLTFTSTRYGKELCMSAIYILKGQHMWMVQSIFPGAEKRARFIGETVVKSVRLP